MAGETAFQEDPQQLAEELARVFEDLDGNRGQAVSIGFVTAAIRAFGPAMFGASAAGKAALLLQRMREHSKRIGNELRSDDFVVYPDGRRRPILGDEAVKVLVKLCPPPPTYR